MYFSQAPSVTISSGHHRQSSSLSLRFPVIYVHLTLVLISLLSIYPSPPPSSLPSFTLFYHLNLSLSTIPFIFPSHLTTNTPTLSVCPSVLLLYSKCRQLGSVIDDWESISSSVNNITSVSNYLLINAADPRPSLPLIPLLLLPSTPLLPLDVCWDFQQWKG